MTMLAAICLVACAETKNEIKVTGDLGDPKPTFLTNMFNRQSLAEGQVGDGVVTFTVDAMEPVIAMIGRSADGRQPLCAVIIDGKPIEVTVKDGKATRPMLHCGICGEHGGDPVSVAFCHKLGLDYVSCSPFRVPIARLAAAQAAIKEAK